MKKYLFVLCLSFIFGCVQYTKKDIPIPETKIYKAKQSFRDYGVDNKISKEVLDSIIFSLPHWRLDKFKTTDFHELLSVELLKNELSLKGFKSDAFVLHLIKRDENGFLSFYLEHTDRFIYSYNLDKLLFELENNPEVEEFSYTPGAERHIARFDGWYTVNMETRKLEFRHQDKY
jgi:hypothetical protein